MLRLQPVGDSRFDNSSIGKSYGEEHLMDGSINGARKSDKPEWPRNSS